MSAAGGKSLNKSEHDIAHWYARGRWLNAKKINKCVHSAGECLTLMDVAGMERLLEDCSARGGPRFERGSCPHRHKSKAYVNKLWEHGMRIPKALIQEVAGWRKKVSRPGVWTAIEIHKGRVVSKDIMLDGVHIGADSNHAYEKRCGAPMVSSTVFDNEYGTESTFYEFVVNKKGS